MENKISQKTIKIIEDASRQLNMNAEVMISLAIKAYLEEKELQEELEVWNQASDEDFSRFEKEL